MCYAILGDIMKRVYIGYPYFYDTLSRYKSIYHLFCNINEQQRNKMFISIDLKMFHHSAETFYQIDIELKDNRLCFKDDFRANVYIAKIENGTMLFNEIDNPFYLLLKRLYRYLIVEEV